MTVTFFVIVFALAMVLRPGCVAALLGAQATRRQASSDVTGAKRIWRLFGFGVVGASGLVVNTLVLALLTEWAGIYYLASALLATEVSIVWNFLLCEQWVFRSRHPEPGSMRRLVFFAI